MTNSSQGWIIKLIIACFVIVWCKNCLQTIIFFQVDITVKSTLSHRLVTDQLSACWYAKFLKRFNDCVRSFNRRAGAGENN